MIQIKKPKQRTIRSIFYFFIGCMIIGIIRLYYLQIMCNKQLLLQSEHNFVRLEKIPQPRGNITDTNGYIIATNKPIINLFWQGTGQKRFTTQQIRLLEDIEKILETTFSDEDRKKIYYAEQFEKQSLISPDIDFQKLALLAEQLGHHTNIMIKSSFKRHYPYRKLASHIIGYLSYQSEPNGRMGLEKIYHDTLKGDPEIKKRTVNAIGKSLREEAFKVGTAGQTIQTTLNFTLQQFAEELFPYDWAGSMIVMDPESGALRVVISRPSFDPGIFLKSISHEEWAKIQNKRPFLNRAFEACYPPASLFKLVVATAALEHNIVTPKTKTFCNGFINYGGRRCHCNKRDGHGEVNFKEAVALSCNIIFYEIGKRISIDTIADYAYRFGLGKPTGIHFPEKIGLIPSSEWKLKNKGERWWQGETVSASIGQTYLLATPLQIARMQSAIFSGVLTQPRILEHEPIIQTPLDINPKTLRFLKKSMRATVEEGTGKRLRDIEDLIIYAKTGTAQISSLKQRMLKSEECREHAWFLGAFSCKEEKPLVIVILVEHAGGSRAPTSIARKFLIKYRDYMNQTYI
jgi:penicillin-binding protein 2